MKGFHPVRKHGFSSLPGKLPCMTPFTTALSMTLWAMARRFSARAVSPPPPPPFFLFSTASVDFFHGIFAPRGPETVVEPVLFTCFHPFCCGLLIGHEPHLLPAEPRHSSTISDILARHGKNVDGVPKESEKNRCRSLPWRKYSVLPENSRDIFPHLVTGSNKSIAEEVRLTLQNGKGKFWRPKSPLLVWEKHSLFLYRPRSVPPRRGKNTFPHRRHPAAGTAYRKRSAGPQPAS